MHASSTDRSGGFALMIAVIAIALIGVTLGALVRVGPIELRARAIAATEKRLDLLAGAIRNWVIDAGSAPSTLAQLKTGTNLGPYVYDEISGESIFDDAFHTPIRYQIGVDDTVLLTSYGPDRSLGTTDDLLRSIDLTGIRGQITRDRLARANAALDAYYQRNGDTRFDAGLAAIYYDDPNWLGTTKVQTDANIEFSWGSSYPIGTNNNFSAEWSGYITPPSSATYTFYLVSAGQSWLYVDDRLIVDASAGGGKEYKGTIRVTGGQALPIYVKYTNTSGGPSLQMKWSATGVTKAIIGSAYLKNEVDALLATIAAARAALHGDALLPDDDAMWTDAWGTPFIADPDQPDGVVGIVSTHVTLPASEVTTDLVGIVYQEDGTPASGATLTLHTGIDDVTHTTTSNSSGGFTFAGKTLSRDSSFLFGEKSGDFGVVSGFTPMSGGTTAVRFFLSQATNVALGRPVIVEGPLASGPEFFPNTNPVVVTDGYMQDTSLGLYNTTNIWWNTADFVMVNVDLGQPRLIVGAIIMVHNNDQYILEYRDPVTKTWSLLWDVPIVDPAPDPGWLWPVRPNHYDWTELYRVGPLYADRVRIYPRSNNTAWVGVNEIQIYGF